MQYTGNTIKLGTELCKSSGCLDNANRQDEELIKLVKKFNKHNKRNV